MLMKNNMMIDGGSIAEGIPRLDHRTDQPCDVGVLMSSKVKFGDIGRL
jgi:hypothetical protein